MWHITDAKDDEPSKKTWLSPPLYVDGLTRNKNGTNWGKYIRTKDQDGNTHRFILTDDKLQGDAREWRKLLAAHGCSPSNKPHAKQLLSDYLHRHPTKTRYTTVSSSGWHGDVYVLPNAVFGANNVLLDKEFATHHSQKGSLSDWQENIAKECIKHDRLTLGLCMAFGGALLELMNMQSIGVHLVSSSSQGKTLTLNLACSVWGKPSDLLKTWNFTANGLEMIVSLHNDNFLALDELGQIGAKEAAKVVYMLGNGAGKGRATKDLSLQDVRTWRTCWLSTGEITLSQKLAEIGKSAHAGELMRMIHLPANSEQGSVFDDVEVGEQGRKLHSRLNDYASRFYGTAGTAWLEYLTADKKGMAELAGGLYDEFMAGFGDLSQQQGRVLGYFALMATAGELATRAGITGWQDGQASQAIANLYHVWLANNKDDLQTAQAIEAIQHFIEQHQFSRFVNATEPSFTPSDIRHTANFAGYITNIKDVGVVYAFNQSAFDEAIKKHGLSRDVCLNILKNHDFLHCNDGGRFKAKIRIENGKNPLSFYAIKAKILEFSKN
ncbi:DUF927 domain-containing protein [Moraxella caviae]|uniref:DUF927 domain-containing protein n=1 Tax=Moraxella caviae TaxID=34060 RepID=UPI0010550C2E|nr:DUF927 domain-containing protein [Moraxella caviae]